MDFLLQIFTLIKESMTPIEIIATFFGVITVYLTVKQNIWLFPTGIVMVTLYIFIFYEAKLYSDMLLQIIYIYMNIYGWYYWLKKWDRTKKDELKISTLSWQETGKWAIIWIVGTCIWGYLMKTFTDATLPLIDAALAVGSLIAQWFLSKKILENWYIWIALDVVFIGVFYYKELHLTAILYFIFLILASSGAIAWNKAKNKQQES